jgi:SSS family solute:Na+ symporter
VTTVHLGPLDVAIVILFVGAIFALGFSARLRENTTLQFIAAGRALTLPVFVATLVATWYGGILGIGESVQWYGIGTWVLFGVPYYAFALLYAVLLAKRIRSAEQISIPERIGAKWGKGPALIAAALVFLLGVPAAHVLMLGTLAQSLTGWGLPFSVIVATFVSSLFLYKGGLLADARVSLLSFTMMYVGFAVIVVFCLVRYPVAEAWSQFEGTTAMKWDGGIGILGVVSFFILGAWTLIDPGFHQRVASSKDPSTGRSGVLVAIVCWIVFDALSVTAGMYAIALMKQPPDNVLLLFPLFGDQVLPQGLKAVFLCGMLGTILTAMVGYSLVSGATLGRDIVSRALGTADEARATAWSRAGIFAACVVAVIIALLFESVVEIWYLWAGVLVGALLMPTLASYASRDSSRLGPLAVSISMLAGSIISVAWLVYSSQRAEGQKVLIAQGVSYDVGTLLPGAVASAIVLAFGALAVGRSRK